MVQDQDAPWKKWPYRLGCPVWACKHWADCVYPKGTSAKDYLNWYSQTFGTVEGNSTFYALPSVVQFQRWRDDAIDGFEFCFKFPRSISHDLALRCCGTELEQFLSRLEILKSAGRLGPTFLQLGPGFNGHQFDALASFLRNLPSGWAWAVELRHADWYDRAAQESALDQMLTDLGIDRVLFDSRPLNVVPASDDEERTAQSRKPQTPYRTTVTGKRPMLRLIGRNSFDQITPFWDQWTKTICDWLDQGLTPYVFTHAPDDRFAPQLAWELHRRVQSEYLRRHPQLTTWSSTDFFPCSRNKPPVQQLLFEL